MEGGGSVAQPEALPPHSSRVDELNSLSVWMFFLCLCGLLVVSSQKHPIWWIGHTKLPLGVYECVNECVTHCA